MSDTKHMNERRRVTFNKMANNDHEIYALLKQRYSPRVFSDREVSDEDLNRLFEAVRWSASSSNLQPWRFIYARKGTKGYDRILDCLSEFNQEWAVNAPILVLTGYKEKNDNGDENFHALHDLGLSLGNMTMQAQYMDIGLHHMAGVDWKKAHKDFEIPDGFHISTAIALGYYGGKLQDLDKDLREQETAKRKRIPQGEFAYKDEWKAPNAKN